ncbi:MAG: hypothetical protein ABI693_35570 [Bryobacteraceae bacterium]
MRAALRQSEGVTPEGVRYTWRATPALSEMNELRGLGPMAVDALSQILLSKNARECQLAVRLMGAFDQSVVLAPMLKGVNNPDVPAACRSFLIAALREAPADVLKPVLDRAATDPDAKVRSEAVRQLENIKAGQ